MECKVNKEDVKGEEDNFNINSIDKWIKDVSLNDFNFPNSLGIFPIASQNDGIEFSPDIRYNNGSTITHFIGSGFLIDNHIYYKPIGVDVAGNEFLKVGAKVDVAIRKDNQTGSWIATSCSLHKKENISNKVPKISTVYENNETKGIVTKYENGMGLINGELTFKVNDCCDYVPMQNDWVKATVASDCNATNVQPLRKKNIIGSITKKLDEYSVGIIDNSIIYTKETVVDSDNQFHKGNVVEVTAVERNQTHNCWRAIKMVKIAKSKLNVPLTDKYSWSLFGKRPLFSNSANKMPSFLPQYTVPNVLREIVAGGRNLLQYAPSLSEILNKNNYIQRFSTLLFIEELQEESNCSFFEIRNVAITLTPNKLVKIMVPGVKIGRPCVLVGDPIKLEGPSLPTTFMGYVHKVEVQNGLLFVDFDKTLFPHCDGFERFIINFTYSRLPFRRCHLAISQAFKLNKNVIFPPSNFHHAYGDVEEDDDDKKAIVSSFFNKNLNQQQQVAITRILHSKHQLPYVIFGPPGTGKTVTIVELILQLVKYRTDSRILVCAPSNSAVNAICMKLHKTGQIDNSIVIRCVSINYCKSRIDPSILSYCKDIPVREAARFQVVLSTCCNAGIFAQLSLHASHFTHVLIDEAGQCMEPICLIPISVAPQGKIVLIGDPKQLGPTVKSDLSCHYSLNISLLERIMSSFHYQRSNNLFEKYGRYNPKFVTKLLFSYRSHPSLLKLPSSLFYDDELVSKSIYHQTSPLTTCRLLPNPGFPLLFYSVKGEERREGGNPSFFNCQEILKVCDFTKLLLKEMKGDLLPAEISILTPYKKQIEKLRMFCNVSELTEVNILTIEEFQGQENKVIILSTVRTLVKDKSSDMLRPSKENIAKIGFISDPKRFNVAITRAKNLLVVFGDASVLSIDNYWKSLIDYCQENNSFIECNETNKPSDD